MVADRLTSRLTRGFLVDHLLAALDEERRQALLQTPESLALIERAVAEVIPPERQTRSETFALYLAERLPAASALQRALTTWNVADLHLCWACLSGDERAVEDFHTRYLPLIQATLRRLRFDEAFCQEVQQQLVMQLLVGDAGRPPLLLNYKGTGKLTAWLRVVTERTAKKTRLKDRSGRPDAERDLAEAVVDPRSSPELAGIKNRYRGAFKMALKEAIRDLDPMDANLLRHRHVDDLNLDEIGRIYRVHLTTIHRRLERIRQDLLQRTYAIMAEKLDIPLQECATVIRLIQSRLDLTLHTFFQGQADGNTPGEDR